MPSYDLLIRGGTVVDGARNPRFRGDVGIAGDRIVAIGRLDSSEADEVIDASGMIVAPGFIDLHTHYDAQVYWDPYLTNSGWHGVTSVVTGNCGFGFAPMPAQLQERAMLSMTRVEAIPLASMREALPWDWETFPQYLSSLDRANKAVNLLPLVPLNPVLVWVLGLDDAKAGRRPSGDEENQIAAIVDEALSAGAWGWSAQCKGSPGNPGSVSSVQSDFDGTPMPTDVMWPETRLRLASVQGKHGRGFIQLATLGGGVERIGFEEWERIAQAAGRPMIYNALVGSSLPGLDTLRRETIEWLRSCQLRGIPIYGQGLTTDPVMLFTLADWQAWDSQPVWREVSLAPSIEEKLRILADPASREGARSLRFQNTDDYEDIVLHSSESEEFKRFNGLSLGSIALETNSTAIDVLFDVVLADHLRTSFTSRQLHNTLDGMRELLDYEYVLAGQSDGGAHVRFLPGGQYTTEYIVEFVRTHELLTLEEAHWRLSALPAFCVGLPDRGVIREGAAADIVVYDFDALQYLEPEFAYDLPAAEWRTTSRASGYRYVVVNGGVTIRDDKETDHFTGRVLRPS